MKTYIVTVRLTVDAGADEHLRTAKAIKDEVKSWLESLDAEVQTVSVVEVQS